jgi:5-methylcytosine-specific restriction endonuclease McrA
MSVSERVAPQVRRKVIDRDQSCCRICGRYVEAPALHHIRYRSHGGPDTVDNLVTVGWQPGHDCHLTVAHGPRARIIAPLLVACTVDPSVTALQLYRWQQATRPITDLRLPR